MPNKDITEIFKRRLLEDLEDAESDIVNLFNDDKWMGQPLTTYYGASPDAEQLVDIAVLRSIGQFATKYDRVVPKPTKAWLINIIEPKTKVFDNKSKNNVLDLLSTAAIHTIPK